MPKALWAVLFISVLSVGCESDPPAPPPPKTETENLIYIEATSYDNRDIIVLNDWLRANPDRKITSLTGILLGSGGDVSGYIARFDRADNSRQRCTRLFARDGAVWQASGGYGIEDLDKWMREHKAFKNLLVVSVPSGTGGSLSYTLCFDGE
ncbi:MAG: hypothetical protein A2676_04920 [Candidatus Sungbacteria bacterium RIFCSPHIGHO2_01_FULL_51_22]|nr:MAG: hypothetical protein A2676_04920 [Candidatus Sungbacteria bacterium RIFCSPHIGHO2_01_FULL_51_22]